MNSNKMVCRNELDIMLTLESYLPYICSINHQVPSDFLLQMGSYGFPTKHDPSRREHFNSIIYTRIDGQHVMILTQIFNWKDLELETSIIHPVTHFADG